MKHALDGLRRRHDRQPAVACLARGARVEQHAHAASVEEADAAEVEHELVASAIERDLDLRAGKALVREIELAVEADDRAIGVSPGRGGEVQESQHGVHENNDN